MPNDDKRNDAQAPMQALMDQLAELRDAVLERLGDQAKDWMDETTDLTCTGDRGGDAFVLVTAVEGVVLGH